MDILREAWPIIFISLLGFCGAVGILAMVSPRAFAIVAETGGLLVTKPKSPSLFESPIDIDQFVIRHSRQFGAMVTVVVTYLGLLFLGYVDATWSPYFLLFIVGTSVCMAFSGLIDLNGQVSKIGDQLAEARIDMLTGLANRRALDDELERRLSEKSRKDTNLCLSILDVDHFKEINDTYGHLTGDNVLANGVASVIRDTKRTMDIAARYGGDEFVIIYPSCKLAQAINSATRLQQAIAAEGGLIDGAKLPVSVSVGVAEANDQDDVSTLLGRADKALYAAKQAGRNQVFQHNGERCQLVETGKAEADEVGMAPISAH